MRAVRRMVAGEKWSECAAPSGECGSAPVMRVVPLGALMAGGPEKDAFMDASTQAQVTHADLHGTAAAVLVALAARDAVHGRVDANGPQVKRWAERVAEFDPRLAEGVRQLPAAVCMDRTRAVRWAARFGPWGDAIQDDDVVGIPGTAGPIALFAIRCWLRSQHAWLPGVLDAIAAGGDTDTAAAVTGGLLGASVGGSRIPGAVLAPHSRCELWRGRRTHAAVRGRVEAAPAIDVAVLTNVHRRRFKSRSSRDGSGGRCLRALLG